MVSSLPKFFRARRNRIEKKKMASTQDIGSALELSYSSTDTESGSLLAASPALIDIENEMIAAAAVAEEVPPQPVVAAAEEEWPPLPPPAIPPSPEATSVQDVPVDGSANGKVTVVDTAEVIDSCGCPVNLRDVIDDIPEEVKEAALTSSLVFMALAGLFFSVVLYRYLRHMYMPEPEGFFCSTFAWLFSPLFNAMCDVPAPGGFLHEMYHESSVLVGEVQDGFSKFTHSIFDGFHAMGTIFSKMVEGFMGNLGFGIHELVDNVRVNLSFLTRFCGQIFSGFQHIFANTKSACADTLSDTFHSTAQNTDSASGFFSP